MKKLNIAVIFGGRSGEHEVSLVSAESVMKNLDRNKYNVIPVGIAKDGAWIAGKNSLKLLKKNEIPKALKAFITPDATSKQLVSVDNKKLRVTPACRRGRDYGLRLPAACLSGRQGEAGITDKIDVVFPVLHGTYGEDGTMQGLLELADLPYVGCGVLASALAMDKIAQKILCTAENILTPDWIWFSKSEWSLIKKSKIYFKKWIEGTEKRLGYPMFIKPANLGSSVGISKAHNRSELVTAINLAIKYDRRVLIEKGIEGALEVEVGVLGNEKPEASIPGQIIPSNEFYDYDAKYVDGKSKAIIPAPLPKEIARKVQDMAVESFKLLDGAGMARVDFLVKKEGNDWKIYLSELNTIPGFTSISMYPKLWEASGVSYRKLLDILVNLALERHREKKGLQTSYRTKKAWYK
ncbi:D-alanine--D-alanine ligase A [Candidatus Kuenenbacteria bacterium RIFCSPLOWO2_02_FULL_42_16]|uniref:D-alanine--D-alanine ligase n=1 Tax=Candidatus Kuenenbacteria bacterium RIFCSPLOWO2_02_FULL_42_16 TaxID=1798564 RepID=A0A1F6FYN6_9BACT|nr:MAG: D-alanine--D-alanine ligase A [Candidatus Kuenenbacteria bacterium RIFCSPLOWO2_02_FULL_42_16]